MSLSSPPLYPASSQWECEACFSSSTSSQGGSRANLTPPQGRLRAAISSSEGGFRAALASLLPWKEGGRREEKGRRVEGSQSSNQPAPATLLDHHPSVAEERRRLYRSHTLSCPGEEGRRRNKAGEEVGRVGVRLRRDTVGRHGGASRAEGLWKRGREREQQKRREEEEGRRRLLGELYVRGSESVGRGEFQRGGKESVRRVKADLAMGGETVRLGEGREDGRKMDEEGGGGRRDMGGGRREKGDGRKGRERLRRALSLPSSKHRAGRGEVRCVLTCESRHLT